MFRESRNRKNWACEPEERKSGAEKYDLSASFREPKSVRSFLQRAEKEAVQREERRRARRRFTACAGLVLAAAGLFCISALVPEEESSSGEQLLISQPAADVFAETGIGRKDWCYTFLVLRRDETAEQLHGIAVGMLDRKEKQLSVVTIPCDLLVETGVGIRTLTEVYADKGAYGVRDRIAGLLGHPVDHYISLSSETAAAVFALLDGGKVFLPPVGAQCDAWCAALENAMAEGYVRNRDGIISLLTGAGVTSFSVENLRWYAGELLKLGAGSVSVYALPAETAEKENGVAVSGEAWLALLNESFNPCWEAIQKENIRAVGAVS